jgi:orotidine-5'-phosphate decarboxylase
VHNDSSEQDDQQRVIGPYQAIAQGADYLVVGRPIRTASDPHAAAESIQQEIARAFSDQAGNADKH